MAIKIIIGVALTLNAFTCWCLCRASAMADEMFSRCEAKYFEQRAAEK